MASCEFIAEFPDPDNVGTIPAVTADLSPIALLLRGAIDIFSLPQQTPRFEEKRVVILPNVVHFADVDNGS